MPRGKRPTFRKGAFYHIYNRGNRKEQIFRYASDRDYFVKKLKKLARFYLSGVIAYCLIDNHYHLVIQQGYGKEISKLMQRLICSYSMHYNKKYNLVGHTFQGRFRAKRIGTGLGLENVIKYLKRNPVEAGYVEKPEHYKWLHVNQQYEGLGDRP